MLQATLDVRFMALVALVGRNKRSAVPANTFSENSLPELRCACSGLLVYLSNSTKTRYSNDSGIAIPSIRFAKYPRTVVLTEGDIAQQAKQLIAEGAQRLWSAKRRNDGYDEGSGITDDSPKARMARSMETYVDGLSDAQVDRMLSALLESETES